MINQLFGHYLVDEGYITGTQLEHIFEIEKKVRVKLGLIAVSEKLMTPGQAEEVNRLQALMDKRFGDIAIDKGYLTPEQVRRLLSLQGNRYLTFAQAVTENGFMGLTEFEKAFNDYQKKMAFTASDMEALKSDVTERVVPLFLPIDCDANQIEHILIAFRTIIRLIDSESYICGSASWVSSMEVNGVALQCLVGDEKASLALTGNENDLLVIAERFAGEKFAFVDDDALDAVAEFINCINGMFATAVSPKIEIDMLPPNFKMVSTVARSGKMLKIPIQIDNRQIYLLSTFNGLINL